MNRPLFGCAGRESVAASLLLLLGGVSLVGSAIGAEQTALAGGHGGGAFVDRPPAGARIGAVRFGTGAWIDSVAVVYVTPDGRRFPSQVHGGSGGISCVIALDPDERILGLAGRHAQYVHSVRLITTKGVSRTCGDAAAGREFRVDVPAGHEAVGLAGRAGLYLDAIGLALGATAPGAMPRPRPVDSPGPAALIGKVRVTPDLHAARLDIRLTAPATVQVNLGKRPLRPGECFGPTDRLVSGSPLHSARAQHRVDFRQLEMNTTYSFVVRVDNGRCESGSFRTSTRID